MGRAKVFRDDKGNRMVFPSMIYDDRADEPLATEMWRRGLEMRAATGLEMEEGWLDIDRARFPHVVTEAGSSGFLHGRATAYLFDGPVFEAIKSEAT